MELTTFQQPELRNSSDAVVQSGAYGKNSAFCNTQNTGILDYINNNLQALYNAQANVVAKEPYLVPCYTTVEQLGLTAPCSCYDILNTMPNNSQAMIFASSTSVISDTPAANTLISFKRSTALARNEVTAKRALSSGTADTYMASVNVSTGVTTWYKHTLTAL